MYIQKLRILFYPLNGRPRISHCVASEPQSGVLRPAKPRPNQPVTSGSEEVFENPNRINGMYIHIYVHIVYMCMCVYIYNYIYMYM